MDEPLSLLELALLTSLLFVCGIPFALLGYFLDWLVERNRRSHR